MSCLVKHVRSEFSESAPVKHEGKVWSCKGFHLNIRLMY